MTRKEEIKYASKDYVNYLLDKQEYHNENYTEYDIQQAFEKGAQWADENPTSHWIDTDEDLPYKHDNLLIKCLPYSSKETKQVLTLSDDGSYQVCVMFVNEEGKWEWSCGVVPCYWMPIPELPK